MSASSRVRLETIGLFGWFVAWLVPAHGQVNHPVAQVPAVNAPVTQPLAAPVAVTDPTVNPGVITAAPTPVVTEPGVIVAPAPGPSEPPAVVTDKTIIDLGGQPDRVTFTFQEAPWGEVLKEFADWSGLTLDMTDTPPGYFNYFDNRPHTPTEAIDILNGYLLPRGYVLLRRDQFLVALRTNNEMLTNLIPSVSVEDLRADSKSPLGDNELVKTIVTVDEISPEAAALEVRGLLGPYGAAIPLENSGSVLLQGFGGGLRQALDTLAQSRPPVTDDKLDFRSFTLVNLPVAEAEAQIRKLFGLASPLAPANVSGARYELDRAAYYRDREVRDSQGKSGSGTPAAPPIPLLKKVAMNMQVSSLERTNHLLVTATPEGLKLVEQILLSIDLPNDKSSAKRWAQQNEPDLRVYAVSSADEGEVAKTLDALMPGVVVNEDRRQDTLHIFATPEQHLEIESLIQKLEQGGGTDGTVEVIALKRANPATAASLLASLFVHLDRDERPTIQPELASRSLVVRGNLAQVAQIREALVKFGEPSEPVSHEQVPVGSRVRKISIGGRSGDAIATAAERILAGDRKFRGNIRVIVPGQSSIAPAAQKTSVPASVPSTKRSGDQVIHHAKLETQFVSNSSNRDADQPSSKQDLGATKERQPSMPPSSVSIEVHGDEIVVYSGDTESLDAVEATIRELIRQIPAVTRWTIFYLKVADAETASLKLMNLMSDSLYPASQDLGLLDERPEPPRIVPDKRTNAIFFSGSDAEVAEAERFLEHIDATEVPGSFLNREPHSIAVQYANVEQIAELLKSLYKDYLTDPVVERLKVDAERRSSSSTRPSIDITESPGIRLTIAVDGQTGELLVACNDQLFQEIKAVVQQRDLAVRDSQPTVEFMRVSKGIPSNIVDMLGGMSDKISATAIIPEEAIKPTSKTSSAIRSSR